MALKQKTVTFFNCVWIALIVQLSTVTYVEANTASNVHLRGVVVPAEQVNLSMNQNGVLRFIAPSGSIVKQGEKLAEINPAQLSAQYHQARAMLQAAKAELAAAKHGLEKSRRLVNENILSDIALTEAEFSVQTASANLEVSESKYHIAKLAVDDAVLYAPFEGVVADTKLKKGEWTKQGDPIIEFASLEALVMSIDLPPELTDNLTVGQATSVNFQGKKIGIATVKRLFPLLQPSSGLRRVVWDVTTSSSVLISGRYVELEPWF